MFNLEDENINLIMGDPLNAEPLLLMADEEKEEAKGKDPVTEESDPESAEGAEEAKPAEEVAEEVAAEQADEQVAEDAPEEEVAEEVAEAKTEEAVTEEPSEEETVEKVAEETAVEEAPSKEEVPTEKAVEAKAEEAVVEESEAEEVSADEVVEEVAESKEEEPTEESPSEGKDEKPSKSEIDPEEAAYVAQQTNVYQATYFDMRKDLPQFRPGDKISVGYRVMEGGRSRIQNFDGVVIKISSGHGMDKTFTVRKVSSGIGVERIFPFHSPNIDSIKVLKEGKVRRAKLYYLRSRVGKAARIKERTSQ